MLLKTDSAIDPVRSQTGILGDLVSGEILDCFDGCRLCWALSEMGQRFPENWFLKKYEHHRLMPGLGCLEVGYVLLVSSQHRKSAAEQREEQIAALQADVATLWSDLKRLDQNWIVFEQGRRSGSGARGGCIDHFHMHMIPGDRSIIARVATLIGTKPTTITSLSDLQAFRQNGKENYIYMMSDVDEGMVFTADEIPSQIVRQAISIEKGNPAGWNWREHPNLDGTFRTTELFKNSGLAPKRIYYAHAIEGLSNDKLTKEIDYVRAALDRTSKDLEIISMHGVAERCVGWRAHGHAIPRHEFVQRTESHAISWCDGVIADVSKEGWQYVGTLMEIALAHAMGIPVVAVVGRSSIANREWLKATVCASVQTTEEAVAIFADYCSTPHRVTQANRKFSK